MAGPVLCSKLGHRRIFELVNMMRCAVGMKRGIGRGLDSAIIVSPKLPSRKFSDLRFVCLKMSVS